MSPVLTDLRWHRLTAAADADTALRAHVRAVVGDPQERGDREDRTDPEDVRDDATVRVGRQCPRCGSSAHGRPWARAADGGPPLWVSLSRTGGHLLTAVSTVGPIGVDVEARADVERRWVPSLVLADGESADSAHERAWWWTAKEAVLKRRGTGLSTPMTRVRLDAERGLARIEAPPGLVAALADPLV